MKLIFLCELSYANILTHSSNVNHRTHTNRSDDIVHINFVLISFALGSPYHKWHKRARMFETYIMNYVTNKSRVNMRVQFTRIP